MLITSETTGGIIARMGGMDKDSEAVCYNFLTFGRVGRSRGSMLKIEITYCAV